VIARCRSCGQPHDPRPLKGLVAQADTEKTIPVAGDICRVDVALLGAKGKILLVIEVRQAHAVDAPKVDLLRRAQLPWIEVKADQVLEDAGVRFVPIASGRVKLSRECQVCREQRSREAEAELILDRLDRLAAPRNSFETSLKDQFAIGGLTDKQRMALGRQYPQERALRILSLLRKLYPSLPFLNSVERYAWEHSGMTPKQIAGVLGMAWGNDARLRVADEELRDHGAIVDDRFCS
jgi:hypothetical protein